jgi:putative nucleotidyltransferase with HDIG domain
MMPHDEKARKLKASVQRIRAVNTIPMIKDKVTEVISREDSSLKDLEAVIRHDPSLACSIVSQSNSSRYATGGKRTGISQALMVMGFNVVRDIVRGIPAFLDDIMTSEAKSLWTHSFEVAEASSDIASRAAGVSKDDAFLAGLLHDIGRIIFYQLFREVYWAPTANLKNPSELLAMEEETFGEGHSKVGAWFLGGGLLPERIALAVENHHCPLKAPRFRELASTVYFAEYLVAMNSDPSAGMEDGADADLKRIYELLQIKETDMVEFMVGVVTRKEKIAMFYGG